jgi:hypothetical protein
MQPSLCKKHFRQVANTFDKETAFAFGHDDKNCVICNKVIFIEAARRFVASAQPHASEEALRLPDAYAHKSV